MKHYGLIILLVCALAPQLAQARNWTCGSTIHIRGFMSSTDYMHKGQDTAALTTWPGGIGNEWRLPPVGPGCQDYVNRRGQRVFESQLISWQNSAIRATAWTYNTSSGRFTPGSVDAGGRPNTTRRLIIDPAPNGQWHFKIDLGNFYGSDGYMHRRETWSGQRIVHFRGDGVGSRWQVTCVKNCR